MAQILRQSTQIVVHIGPFVDVTDGFTPEVGVTLSGADEAEIMKGGATTVTDISGATWAAITGADGWYNLTLTTSHTDTVGPLVVIVNDDSVCLPVFARFQVIEEATYDSIYAASAASIATAAALDTVDNFLDTEIAAILAAVDTEVAAILSDTNAILVDTAEIGVAGAGLSNINLPNQTMDITGNITGNLSGSVGSVTGAVGSVTTVTSIVNGILDEDMTGHQTQGTLGQAIGDPVADTNTIYKATVTDATGATVGVDVAAVLVDTTEIGAAGAGLTALSTQASVNTIDDFLDTEIAAIKTTTDKFVFTVANQVDANVQYVNDVAITGNGAGTPFNVV